MVPFIVQLFVGWVGMITSLLLSIIGIITKKVRLVIIGSILTFPISIYLSGTPRFKYFMVILPLFQFASAYFLHRRVLWLSWLLIVPFTILVIWLGMDVINQ
ncbi:hypothetical protein [Vulcanibacillus modesticaldus]|uniref:hypothetical protein n=1 Tax=Vulcanibacillus modesticaldus TaxID=337097 RepID=UPI000A03478D|nr:hypothetical protein [Vulcanibacillus modesticaldus]